MCVVLLRASLLLAQGAQRVDEGGIDRGRAAMSDALAATGATHKAVSARPSLRAGRKAVVARDQLVSAVDRAHDHRHEQAAQLDRLREPRRRALCRARRRSRER
jgi:hypothetical protein